MANAEWWQEYQNGHYRRTAELLEQMNDCDSVDCLLTLGTLYLYGMHLFESEAECMRFMDSAPVEQQRAFWETAEESRLRGVALLERAAEKGSWAAAQNLANYYYFSEVNGLAEQERLSKAKHYYTLEEKLRPAQL